MLVRRYADANATGARSRARSLVVVNLCNIGDVSLKMPAEPAGYDVGAAQKDASPVCSRASSFPTRAGRVGAAGADTGTWLRSGISLAILIGRMGRKKDAET